jgi:hypothetical protein
MRNIAGIHSFLIISIITMAYGCSLVNVPLKGNYNSSAVEMTTTQPIDSVWSKLTDIFTKNGLPVKRIDKTKGSISTRNAPINAVYTFENTDGQLEQPGAWVVLYKVYNKNKEWKPEEIRGQWSIQVTEKEKGTTNIKIDPLVICTYFPKSFVKFQIPGQSTGKLEELLQQSLKNN